MYLSGASHAVITNNHSYSPKHSRGKYSICIMVREGQMCSKQPIKPLKFNTATASNHRCR